jgi:hypothetical protein
MKDPSWKNRTDYFKYDETYHHCNKDWFFVFLGDILRDLFNWWLWRGDPHNKVFWVKVDIMELCSDEEECDQEDSE